MTKNIAAVRRQTNRLEKGGGGRKNLRTQSTCDADASHPDADRGERSPVARKLYQRSTEDDAASWSPGMSTAFKILVSLRMSAGIWSPISDCDETYNYWEPLHLLLYGSGFQTWEYSPVYAIRSYAYISLHTLPVKLFQTILPHTKVTTFFYLRCFIGLLSSLAEVYLYRALCRRFGNSIGRIFVTMSALSSGMFISSCAFLPSSFSMTLTTLSLALWLEERLFLSVLCVAISALVGWPFAAILGLPVALDMVFERRRVLAFMGYSAICGWAICTMLVAVDSHFYGRWVLAPLNIILYNVFTNHGPSLYGTEPLSYYLVNLSLNWNVAWPLAISSILTTPAVFQLSNAMPDWSKFRQVMNIQIAMVSWLVIFFSQPHKEERFLFPVYPLICLCAAVGLDALERLLTTVFSRFGGFFAQIGTYCTAGALLTFLLMSGSRSLSVYRNYHAPFDSYMSLSERMSSPPEELNPNGSPAAESLVRPQKPVTIVCVGKEWYRFPGHFFLPERLPGNRTVEFRFIKSEFAGLLPKPYERLGLPESTRAIPSDMNDLNREEPSRYTPVSSCDYLVDLETSEPTPVEPNYSANRWEWKMVHKEPFLISHRSHRLFRAFFFPFISDHFVTMGRYVVLERISGFSD